MSPATCLWIAHAATAGLAFILIWAAVKIWREADDDYRGVLAAFVIAFAACATGEIAFPY